MSQPILRIRDLRLEFKSWQRRVEVLHGISLYVMPGERVALVGESGSGKSVTARIVLGLLQQQHGAHVAGTVEFEGEDLAALDPQGRQSLLGTQMTMIFQDPTSSLNPVFLVGDQFREVLRRAQPGISKAAAYEQAAKFLSEVSLPDGDRVLNSYPHQLSGGTNQRVMIAMALVNEPKLLIADEPGTALDVTVQNQTLELMGRLVDEHETAVLFISHNLGVVREFADWVYVIYNGRIVEAGSVEDVFHQPGHPYTKALMAAVPRITGNQPAPVLADPEEFATPMFVHQGDDPAKRRKVAAAAIAAGK